MDTKISSILAFPSFLLQARAPHPEHLLQGSCTLAGHTCYEGSVTTVTEE